MLLLNHVNSKNNRYNFIHLKYQQWQKKFFRERLEDAIKISAIAFPCIILILAIIGSTFQLIFSYNIKYQLFVSQWNWYGFIMFLLEMNLVEVSLLLCWLAVKNQKLCFDPEQIFLFFSFSLTVLSQFHFIRGGFLLINPIPWLITFPTQAMLIPVRWRSHFLSQLLFTVCFLLGCVVFVVRIILRFNDINHPISQIPLENYQQDFIFFGLLCLCYLLAIIFVGFTCSFGVFLYERYLRSEFEYRQRMQLFLHAVSHDLRNPVIGTGALLRLILSEIDKNGEIQEDVQLTVDISVIENLLKNNYRQLKLIDSLIEIHQIETQGINLHRQATTLHSLIYVALNDIQELIVKHQAQIFNNISKNLPIITVDIIQIIRVYQNLITNALKYNPPGVVITLIAEMTIKENREWLYCQVIDNGIGINPEHLENIFNPYFRGDRNHKSIGFGLGLYICQEIIHAHGGKIRVWSNPNKGTTFEFTVPV